VAIVLATLSACSTGEERASSAAASDATLEDAPSDGDGVGDERDPLIDAHFPTTDVADKQPDCPLADYHVTMTGEIRADLRHFSAFSPTYGRGNDWPSLLVLYRPDPRVHVVAATTHDPKTDDRDIVIDVLNRQITLYEDYTKTVYQSAPGEASVTITGDDGVNSIVEGAFEGVLHRVEAGVPGTEAFHVKGELRVCHVVELHIDG
jgi:hypothetical protein